MVFLAEKIPRRMQRFHRKEQQEFGSEADFETGADSEEMGKSVFEQLKKKELQKPEAVQLAVSKVNEFKRKHNRLPQKSEYDQIAESIWKELEAQAKKSKSTGSTDYRKKGENIYSELEKQGLAGIEQRQRQGMEERTRAKQGRESRQLEQKMPEENQKLRELKELEVKDILEENPEEAETGTGEEEFSLAGLETETAAEKKCPNCGKPTEETLFCSGCGNAFCEKCGKADNGKIICPKCKKIIKN